MTISPQQRAAETVKDRRQLNALAAEYADLRREFDSLDKDVRELVEMVELAVGYAERAHSNVHRLVAALDPEPRQDASARRRGALHLVETP